MKFKSFVIGAFLFAIGIITAEAGCEFSQNMMTIEKGMTVELAYSCDGNIPFCTTSNPDVVQLFRKAGRWVAFGKGIGNAEIKLYDTLESEQADSVMCVEVKNEEIIEDDKKNVYHSGDDFTTSANDGSNGWMFEMSTDGKKGISYTPLPRSIVDGWYDGIGKIFCRAEQTSLVVEKWAARTFIAPEAGVVKIYDTDNALQQGSYFKILKNDNIIYPIDGKCFIEGNGNFLVDGLEIRVAQGDKIRFCYIAKTSDTKIWTQQKVEYISFGENDAFTTGSVNVQQGELKLLEYFEAGNGRLPECTSSDKSVVMPILIDDRWYILGIKAGEAQLFLQNKEYSEISIQTVQVEEYKIGENSAINSEWIAVCENQTIPIAYIKGSDDVDFSIEDNTVCEILQKDGKFYINGKKEGKTILTLFGEDGLREYREVCVIKSYPDIRQFIQNQSTAIENQGTEDRTVFSAYAAYNDEKVMTDSDCSIDLVKSGAGSMIVQRTGSKENISMTKYMLWESINSMKPITNAVSSIFTNKFQETTDAEGGE